MLLAMSLLTGVGTATYDPYGRLTASTGIRSPLGFAGEYTDAETGFVYLRARYYDPATGQFLSRDPLLALTQEPYGYVGGNPLNYNDPLGLFALKDAFRGVSLLAGGFAVGVGVFGLIASAPVTVTVAGLTLGVAALAGGVSLGAGAIASGLQCRETGGFSRACKQEIAGVAVDVVSLAVGLHAAKLLGRLGGFLAVGADVVGMMPDIASYHAETRPSAAWVGRAGAKGVATMLEQLSVSLLSLGIVSVAAGAFLGFVARGSSDSTSKSWDLRAETWNVISPYMRRYGLIAVGLGGIGLVIRAVAN